MINSPAAIAATLTLFLGYIWQLPGKSKHSGSRVEFHTPKAYILPMFTFVESNILERELSVYMDDDECAALQWFLMEHPEAGDVIGGAGGVRKLRWKRPGMGKRGGVRVIYYVRYRPDEFWRL
jgi:hypothetical protein